MNKLKSRKLWCAISGTALSILAVFFAPEVVENIEQFIVMLSPLLVYIVGQSAVDCCKARGESRDKREDEGKQGFVHTDLGKSEQEGCKP